MLNGIQVIEMWFKKSLKYTNLILRLKNTWTGESIKSQSSEELDILI